MLLKSEQGSGAYFKYVSVRSVDFHQQAAIGWIVIKMNLSLAYLIQTLYKIDIFCPLRLEA